MNVRVSNDGKTEGIQPDSDLVIELRDVERTYYVGSEPVHALRGVSLKVPRGKLVIIKGPSGSGKTTMLNIMGGLDEPSSGQVLFNGRELNRFSGRELTEWRRRKIGFVFQSFALVQSLTAFENVELPMRIVGTPWKERLERAYRCLEIVGLRSRASHRTFELSGGEQQRVGIARALVNRPALILADEPTGEVDYATGMQIMNLFNEMVHRERVTICVATHDPAAMEFGDLAFEISDGSIVERK